MIELHGPATAYGIPRGLTVPQEVLLHGENVAGLAMKTADVMELGPYERLMLWWGARIHDVGKVNVPKSVLEKPARLSEAERDLIRRHPEWGAQLLSDAVPFMVREVVLNHHERWDGEGYPRGLRRTDIPLLARIVAVCDVLEALLTDRPYRAAWTRPAALAYLHDQAERAFDPKVVQAITHVTPTSA